MTPESRVPESPASEPLVLVGRGRVVESIHRGHIAAVDAGGAVVAQAGSPDALVFLRSSCKPHQAVPLVATGAARRFGFTPDELAVACGSHNGEPVHTGAALSMLRKMGLTPAALKCGAHEPYSKDEAERLRESGERPTALHNNCSGNHAGILALALHLGASPETYDQLSGPAQQEILRAISAFSGLRADDIPHATDGCGIPTFAVPLRAAALMGARLFAPPADFDADVRGACRALTSAMIEHPQMVEGDGELDTELTRACAGRLVSKVGAEGVYLASVAPSERWPGGLGVALKIEDGDKKDRARPAAVVETLRQLGLLGDVELKRLSKFVAKPVENHRGEKVGEVSAAFRLKLARAD
jgi:L-asparaginase II